MLALGDTNYSTFCGGGKTIEKGLARVGASRFMPTVYCDEAEGMEKFVEPWFEQLWGALKNGETSDEGNTKSSKAATPEEDGSKSSESVASDVGNSSQETLAEANPPAAPPVRALHVAFASETGTAEALAKRIHSEVRRARQTFYSQKCTSFIIPY